MAVEIEIAGMRTPELFNLGKTRGRYLL